jgi:hypothetical protein
MGAPSGAKRVTMFESANRCFQILNCDLSVTFAVAEATAVYGQPSTVNRRPFATRSNTTMREQNPLKAKNVTDVYPVPG